MRYFDNTRYHCFRLLFFLNSIVISLYYIYTIRLLPYLPNFSPNILNNSISKTGPQPAFAGKGGGANFVKADLFPKGLKTWAFLSKSKASVLKLPIFRIFLVEKGREGSLSPPKPLPILATALQNKKSAVSWPMRFDFKIVRAHHTLYLRLRQR